MVCGAWARLRRASSGGPRWSGWSSGRRSGGCISSAGCRSARSIGGRGCIGTRSGGRWPAMSPPRYSRPAKGSKLDPFKARDRAAAGRRSGPARGPGRRAAGAAWAGTAARRSWMTTCARSGRCFRRSGRRSARSTGPGEICQFDVWEPKREIPVGHGQTRKGYVVVACLGYSRAGAGALIFSKQTPDLLAGIRRCLWKLGGLAETLVWDRQAGIHAYDGRPTQEFAALLRPAAGRLAFLRQARPAGQGRRRALAGLRGDQLRAGPGVRERARLPGPVRRAGREGQRAPAPHDPRPARSTGSPRSSRSWPRCRSVAPDTDRRWVLRVAPDPYVRFDGCDYSLDPDLVGRRVEVRVGDRELTATALDTGELACRHAAVVRPAPDDHRARARPRAQTPPRRSRRREPVVQTRSLDVYDRLIA